MKSYFYYVIAFYAFAFYGIWAQLVVQYVLHDLEIEQAQILAVVNFLPALGIPFLIISWIMLLKVSLFINGASSNRNEFLLHMMAFVLIAISIGTVYFLARNTIWWHNEQFLFIEYGLLFLADFIYILLFMGIIFKGRNGHVQLKSNIFYFSTLFIGTFITRVIVLMLTALYSYLLAPAIIFYFLSGIIPILYLRYFADSTLEPLQAANPDKNNLDEIFNRYQVSKRERQIVRLICHGKSNQQIADELFISLQTVKDHTHRIYTKVGINSRLQLVALINE